jgi:hypothetical protein
MKTIQTPKKQTILCHSIDTPQWKVVLDHLLLGYSFTGLDALREFGIISFPKRICEIEKIGYKVERKLVMVKGRFGEKRVNRYWIEQSKLSV